jgi:hypothetical protein
MRKYVYIAVLLMAATSCKVATTIVDTTSELLRGEVVARAGSHKLHREQLESYIPTGVSREDSINLAHQYINAWAEDLLLVDMAEEQLSETEKDVSAELEDYRRTLLKYRYEQRYIEQRLDTLITDEEIVRYYNANLGKFLLERPIVKARYLTLPAGSKNLNTLRKLISSDDAQSAAEAANLSTTVAIRYVDAANAWQDALLLAQDLGMDYGKMMASLKGQFVEWTDENKVLHLACLVDMIPEGRTAPLEYCIPRIRDLILSGRKHELEAQLEQDVLQDARKNKKLVIY